MELHHINGNREDNHLENVIMLCDKHHKMAHAGIIDRKSLVEYKHINQQWLGISNESIISDASRSWYLKNLSSWALKDRQRRESPNFGDSLGGYHVEPALVHTGQPFADQGSSNNKTINVIYESIVQDKCCLLLGNGGSGKTITLLSLVLHLADIADNTSDESPLPIYVPLYRVTISTSISMLLLAALRKHGVQISSEKLDSFLNSNKLCLIFDGLNEINKAASEQGALEDILNLFDRFPNCYFVISSRYITNLDKIELPRLELAGWNSDQISRYLVGQLGTQLGEEVFRGIGDDLDFEWLTGCSIAGLCTNPLTLWMLATVALKKGSIFAQDDDLIDSLIELGLNYAIRDPIMSILPSVLQDIAEDLAYFMLDEGDIFSTTYTSAVSILVKLINDKKDEGLISKNFDAYEILSLLIHSGLLRQENQHNVEWIHQVIQERLSIRASERRFGEVIELAQLANCPTCGYRPDNFFETDEALFGVCNETSSCGEYPIILPSNVTEIQILDNLEFIDQTGVPTTPGMITYPTRLMDERWMAYMPVAGMTYISCLRRAQDEIQNRSSLNEFLEHFNESKPIVLLELTCLTMAGILQLDSTEDLTRIRAFVPPIAPNLSLYGYNLVTLRHLSSEELNQDPEERFIVTSKEKEEWLAERREKNLPNYCIYPFSEDDKNKVFELAHRFGGQVRRTWGVYEEIVAEFPGNAWDFTGYKQEAY